MLEVRTQKKATKNNKAYKIRYMQTGSKFLPVEIPFMVFERFDVTFSLLMMDISTGIMRIRATRQNNNVLSTQVSSGERNKRCCSRAYWSIDNRMQLQYKFTGMGIIQGGFMKSPL